MSWRCPGAAQQLTALLTAAVSIVLIGVLAILYFDRRGEGPLSDESMYQWSAQQMGRCLRGFASCEDRVRQLHLQ
ncbi:MAG: hypothetical protein ACR2MY_14150 [Candidatus Dormibacteria bacterium]